jgi:hypothetical protein
MSATKIYNYNLIRTVLSQFWVKVGKIVNFTIFHTLNQKFERTVGQRKLILSDSLSNSLILQEKVTRADNFQLSG